MTEATANGERVVEGRAVEVTFYEDRAEVVREAVATLAAGPQWVSVRGATPFLDDRSVRATCEGAAVLGTRVVRRFVAERGASPAEVAGLEDRRRDLSLRVALEEARRERAQARAALAHELLEDWREELQAVPFGVGEEGGAAEWRGAWDRCAAELAAARAEELAATEAISLLEREAQHLGLQIGEARREKPRLETLVAVQLDVPAAGEVKLRATYRTPCAIWRPEHHARLRQNATGPAQVELTTHAAAWQATGEEWTDVLVRFSTARPARPALPPLLGEDLLSLRRKTDEERRQVVVEARDQKIQVTGAEGGRRAVDEMPGVDDGGEPLSYAPSARITIPSNGRPLRVELERRRLDVEVGLVLYPERTAAPHLRALATLSGAGPLLAGPVRVSRGSALVGRSRLDFTAPGEALELGFGPDDGVRVRRTVREERDTQPITGRQKFKRFVTLYLSNLSGEPRTLDLVERVPVSEIEDLEIALAEAGGFKAEGKDGLVRQQVPLAPRAHRTIEFAWEARAGSKVVLPF